MATIGTAIKLNDMMSSPIRNITNAMNMMLSSWESLDGATSGGLDVNGVESIRSEINRATQALDNMGDEQREFNREVQRGDDVMGGLTDSILGAVGAFVGLQGIGQLVNLSDEYTNTTARLNMINDGLQTTEELSDKIFGAAQRATAKYGDLADMVAKLSLNAGDAFDSNDETILFAETLNKMYGIAGTSAESVASANLQLTQALGSGVLRGEEFNAVFEAAPNIMHTVAEYMNIPVGKLREMAGEGKITADIVKNALIGSAEEVSEQFAAMPMTWSQVWTTVMNELYMISIPILEFINMLANNWSTLEPIVLGAATAIGLYTAALLIYKGISAATALADGIRAAATMMSTGATFGATAAQHGFNAALLACPLTWIIFAIIALVVIIYAVVAAVNKWKDTTVSATGIIMGALAVAGAFIWNVVIGVLNGIIQAAWSIVEPILGVVEWILNACNGGFNSFGGAVANLIGQIISWFLSLGKVVTKIIDAIFGTDWTGELSSLQDDVLKWGKNEDAITIDREAPTLGSRIGYGDAWDAGYAFGEGIDEHISGMFGGGSEEDDGYNPEALLANLGNVPAIDDIASNTGAISDSLDITNEDLKYLRDLAEQETINRFTTAEIRVELGGVTNNVTNNTDLDGVMDYLVTGIQEGMERVAEGVHS